MSSPWQSQLKDLKSRAKHLFETKVLSDCTFVVGKEDGQLVKGHKVIVSAASPVLQEKLAGAGGDHPKITLTDVEPDVFQLMLKYIYTDTIDLNADTVCDLGLAAKAYQLTYLLKECLDYISVNLTPKNVLQAYSLALDSSENDDLKEKCEEVIKTKTKEVLTESSFEEACLDVVVAVFSLDTLEIDSELDLLNAADRYAKHISKCKNADGNPLTIRNVLEKIRFLTLTTEEFGEGRTSTSVLSDSDACAILNNIVYKNSKVPMPAGFSQSRDARKKEIKITFRVPDIEDLLKKQKCAYSSKYLLQNLKWNIEVCGATKDSVNYLTIHVNCDCDSESNTWSCIVDKKYKLLRTDKKTPFVKNSEPVRYSRSEPNWGYLDLIEVSKLLDPNNHYIEDGAITIEVLIAANKPQDL